MARKSKAPSTERPPPPDEEEDESGRGARSFWSGTLSFGLVSIPVSLYSAYRPLGVALHTLSPEGVPLKRRYVCSKDGRPIDREQIVRGYALEKDRYVVLSDEELESLEPKRSRDIELTRFVDIADLSPLLFERAYFLAPSGPSLRAYQLLAATLARLGKAGIASFVLRDKQHLVAIFSEHDVLLAETLRFPDELRSPEDIPVEPTRAVPPARIAELRRAIREHSKSGLALGELRDERAARLHALVERKRRAGEDTVRPEVSVPEPSPTNVIDLMTQLKRSLAGSAAQNGDGARKHAHQARAPARKKPTQRRAQHPST